MRGALWLSVLLALAGCAAIGEAELQPAPGIRSAQGPEQAAATESEDVLVAVRADAWDADPETLDERLTPLLVTIENRGDRPLEIRYSNFSLTGPPDRVFEPLPPFVAAGAAVEEPAGEGLPGFHVAPYLSAYYPDMTPVPDAFPYDRAYYDIHHPAIQRLQEPTDDMIRLALPEGVLEPASLVSGFLYFEEVDPSVPRVTFQAELVDAASGEQFGTIVVPFVTQG